MEPLFSQHNSLRFFYNCTITYPCLDILQKINKVSSHLIRYDSIRYKKLFKLVMKCQYYLKPGHVFTGAELKTV